MSEEKGTYENKGRTINTSAVSGMAVGMAAGTASSMAAGESVAGAAVVNFEEYAMSTEGVLKQVAMIQNVMREVMRKDEHYGTIPGTHKPSLYKPGAEKLSLVFRLRPEYKINRYDLPNGHREYEVLCTLYHIPTGQSVGQGVGSATTMEGKYRYREGGKEGTGRAVPKEYWNLKKEGKKEEAKALIGGPGFGVGKIDGQWEICKAGEKQEHDNPADFYNTILKVSKKRAHVDAILTATAASDIFTQDVEDMPEVIPGAKEKSPEQEESIVLEPPKETRSSNPKADFNSIMNREIERVGPEEMCLLIGKYGFNTISEITDRKKQIEIYKEVSMLPNKEWKE